jgi:Asp-tRNA(Asn)/Glu-tRNA(Gln) amidotransferase A subunit family amidase
LKNNIADEDGPMVAALRGAGAIILGKTNVPQTLGVVETDNAIWGRTNNPWDLTRTPGGSSGGEAAIIAAGGSPLGLGGDLGISNIDLVGKFSWPVREERKAGRECMLEACLGSNSLIA